ncbi:MULTISPECIES: ANTAR domain-containing response regulator [Psychrilyobacter]|uniref:Response regulator n=1 Tax=Psychrilyobacter piezotolerans TaxID=2293438 RepID=A0ABX9KG17_9FUSO|nr:MULTISPECIES: response regulator [Psychrilyobacter]MCS5422403.1 response regulator [Psychrilyobacter sp. S5]NDI78419.1 response regulator [Psychrilyobacter piezotolerans]RDE61144.1 response regulator [Psychrilyobacter sp. S5]REI40785.1 response regulator [Psychrilyobacter piezotolerans]
MKISVVIAEDDPLTRMDIVEILTEAGYDVIGEASDGIEAITVCKEKNPDIVLLDIKMPIITGLQVSKILADENFEGCTVLLTAYNIEEYINKASENKVMGYLLKPIEEKTFLSHLKLIFNNYKNIKSLKKEVKEIKETLDSRKMIERAKGIIMNSTKVSEDEAYRILREVSMTKRVSMLNLSKIIIATGEFNDNYLL